MYSENKTSNVNIVIKVRFTVSVVYLRLKCAAQNNSILLIQYFNNFQNWIIWF